MKVADVDKNANYLVPLEHFDIEVSPYTVFEQDGTCVRVSGERLKCLLRNGNRASGGGDAGDNDGQIVSVNMGALKKNKKSCKNCCFKNVKTQHDVTDALKSKIANMPPCMSRLLDDFKIRSRGDRYRKRFVFNCYLINTLTCTACDRQCFVRAAAALYNHEEKCVREMIGLLKRKNDCYKPPNCSKMLQELLCFKSSKCRGTNPLCNS
uniref:Late expression factor 2 n=1 Tax=Lymantria dispar multicapsid nuclear polyhedrosis virus TaxID=10449 RepID=A0A1B1MQZ7_NPVLD|nr:late expression factor 2 [Lymantria dispar multiple nucleopolyhedrovirus]